MNGITQQQLETEQIRYLHEGQKSALGSSFLLALLWVVIFSQVVSLYRLLIWFAVLSTVMVYRLLQYRAYLAHPERNPSVVLNRIFLGVAATGMVWGSSAIFFYPVDNPAYEMFMGVTLLGVTIGGMVSYLVERRIVILFFLITPTPFIIRMLISEEVLSLYLFIASVIFLILTVSIIQRVYVMVIENITLKITATQSVDALMITLEDLKQSQAQLRQADKMSALGQLVAGVLHEINTPLAYVKNSLLRIHEGLPPLGDVLLQSEQMLGLIKSGDPQNLLSLHLRKLSQSLNEIKQNNTYEELLLMSQDGLFGTNQMSSVVSNMRNFSHLNADELVQFNLNEAIQNCLLLTKPALQHVCIQTHLGTIPRVLCISGQISQVLLNIIINAAQAMPPQNGKLTLTSYPSEQGVAIDIEDNGVGMDEAIINKIFDPFFTTKKVGEGTGLGLSISYKIMQVHGGKINVQSTLGKGTKFTLWLPLTPPESHANE
jgi:signal transduction histidine kinase